MCDRREDDDEMEMLQKELDQKRKQLNTRKIDAILKRGIKRYNKALARLAKN
jgi:hypothetical protein